MAIQIATPDIAIKDGRPGLVNDVALKNLLGGVYFDNNGNAWRYVRFNNGQGNVAAAAGGVVYWFTGSPRPATGLWTVTSDQTDSSGGINGVAGIIGGIVTDGYYTWIQVGGVALATLVAASTAVGDHMIGSATDLTFARVAAQSAPTNIAYGTALTAIASGVSDVLLMNLAW